MGVREVFAGMGNKTKDEQTQFVVKSNDLIRKTRYDLTTQQQKIILYAISKIKPTDAPNTLYEINIEDLCAACGIDIDDGGGYYYNTIKKDLVDLTRRLWVQMPDKSEATVSWIGDAMIVPLSGKVYIKFHEKMGPYLFELHHRYTQYQLKNVLVFKGKYAIRLYEILRSYTTQEAISNGIEKEVRFSLSELREILAVEKYSRWADFERYVIKKAVQEINKYSDEMKINYNVYKEDGRTVSSIVFIIGSLSGYEVYKAHQEEKKQLRIGERKIERKKKQTEKSISKAEQNIKSWTAEERKSKIEELAQMREKGKQINKMLQELSDKQDDNEKAAALKEAETVISYFVNLGLIK